MRNFSYRSRAALRQFSSYFSSRLGIILATAEPEQRHHIVLLQVKNGK